MKFIETNLNDAYVIEIEPHKDERGFFSRFWCRQEFESQGLDTKLVQCNISFSERIGTLRGMHYQIAPFEETKLIRCTMGAISDVIIDLRSKSSTFKKWFSIELNSENHLGLFVPKGFAHGFQTLKDNTEVFYMMGEFYHPECERGIRWDDPMFKIEWPIETKIISSKDQSYPDWKAA